MNVLQGRRGRADDDDLAGEDLGGRRCPRARPRMKRSEWSPAGHESRSARSRARSANARPCAPRLRPPLPRSSVDPTTSGVGADDSAGVAGHVRRQPATACARARFAFPPRTLVCPGAAHCRGRKHHVLRAGDGCVEREILARGRGLGELNVVRDGPRAVRVQSIDHLAVQRSWKRPLKSERGKRPLIDRDHDDVVRTGRSAHTESQRDRCTLQARPRVDGVERATDRDGKHRGRHRGDRARTPPPAPSQT